MFFFFEFKMQFAYIDTAFVFGNGAELFIFIVAIFYVS